MNIISLAVAFFQFLLAFGLRVVTTHLISKALVYGDNSIGIPVKIYLVEIVYHILVSITVALMFYGFGIFSPLIGVFLAGITGLLLGIWVLYRMIKFTANAYDTNFFEGGVIYITPLILAGLINAGIYFISQVL